MNSKPRALGTTIGIVAAYLVHEGIYHMMLVGSCSTPAGPGEVECPPEAMRYFFFIFSGIILGVVATFVGGSWLSFVLLFAGIGTGGIRAGLVPAEQGGQAWFVFFGLCFFVGPAIMLVSIPFVGWKRMQAARLVEHGARGVGTVLSIEDTGITINNNPRIRLAMRIEPSDGITPPFEARKTTTMSRVHLPRVGDRYDVFFDPEDRDKWGFAVGGTLPDPARQPGLRKIVEMAKAGARPASPSPHESHAVVGELNRLNELRLTGKISAEEFAAKTAELLRASPG